MSQSLFAANYQDKPYWWEAAPRPDLPPVAPPARADVAIIGSGYTGLTAAIELARGGRHVVVLDAQDAGWGCSSRNGGQVSTSLKPSFDELEALHGRDLAFRIRREGINALAWIGDFIEREKLDCDWARVGRFHAAHNPAAFETLARSATRQPKGLEVEVFVVPREEQRREIGSQRYHGGVVYPAHASLHPAKYHRGLLSLAQAAGAQVISHCPVLSIQRESEGFRLTSPRGTLQAPQPQQPGAQRYAQARLLLPPVRGAPAHDLRRPGRLQGDEPALERTEAPRPYDPHFPGAHRQQDHPWVDGLRRLHLRHPAPSRPAAGWDLLLHGLLR